MMSKTGNVRRELKQKCKTVKMHLKLRDQQLRIIIYIHTHIHTYPHTHKHRLLHINVMVIKTQKSIMDIYTKRERNPNILLNIIIKSQGKKAKERNKKTTKTMNNMAISTHLSITALNVNGLNAPIKRHRLHQTL